jgi:membrane peptidoglycan carboxypeptidase
MEAVVERGTARSARIDGHTIAGKTGTAAKLVNGRYSRSEYNASFVGFLPSRSPVVSILVVIDSPHGKGYYGGAVAAPVFRRIAEAALRHLGVPPSLDPAPPVLVARNDAEPDGATALPVRAPAILQPVSGPAVDYGGLMPDLRGLGARHALRVLAKLGMDARLDGVGLVVEQDPAPGTPVERGFSSRLSLRRQPPATGGFDP